MLLGTIYDYRYYRHCETGREVQVKATNLQIKTESRDDWHTAVKYSPLDKPESSFAVPVDVFRRKFEEVKE